MIKVIENLQDKFTTRELSFVSKKENIMEVLDMFQESMTKHSKAKMELSIDRETSNTTIVIYMTDVEWLNLLTCCKNKKFQLVIKNDPDIKHFTKQESK